MPRRRVSRHLKLLRGSETRHIQKSPQGDPAGRMWKVPGFIGEHGAVLWKRLGPILRKQGLLTDLDKGSFEAFCLTYDVVVDMAMVIKREGKVIEDGRNSLKKHPANTILNSFLTLFRQFSGDFGCTPAARSHLGIELKRDKPENPWEAL